MYITYYVYIQTTIKKYVLMIYYLLTLNLQFKCIIIVFYLNKLLFKHFFFILESKL